MAKKFTSADPTANAAIGEAGGNFQAEQMRRRARIREARDQAQREAVARRKVAEAGEVG